MEFTRPVFQQENIVVKSKTYLQISDTYVASFKHWLAPFNYQIIFFSHRNLCFFLCNVVFKVPFFTVHENQVQCEHTLIMQLDCLAFHWFTAACVVSGLEVHGLSLWLLASLVMAVICNAEPGLRLPLCYDYKRTWDRLNYTVFGQLFNVPFHIRNIWFSFLLTEVKDANRRI